MPQKNRSAGKNPFVPLLAQVAARLEPRLNDVLRESEARAHGHGSEVGHMVGAVRSLCERGGKRLRPGLCVAGALCADEEFDWTPAIEAGVSLELLQAYFLIHDDWMDQDDERRGGPTAHIELERRFKSKALGERSAVLAGDHAVALSSLTLANVATSPSRLKKCMIRFAEMQLDAVAGQQLDIVGKTPDPELTYELKTASYTVKGPLLLGAELAGASKKTLEALEAFSLPAGVAFQLRDDLMGVFGSSSTTGKSQGGDLKEGKNTSLIAIAKKKLHGRDLQRLTKVFGNRKASPAEVRAAMSALEQSGARALVEDRILELKKQASEKLETPALTRKGRALLDGAVVALADRKA